MINHAIYEAYREWLPVGRHPVYCLFIDLDPALVDVNVHPAKREVRISDERALYDLVLTSIRSLLAPASSSIPQKHSGMTSGLGPDLRRGDGTVAERVAAIELQTPLAFPEKVSSASLADLHYLGQFQKVYLLFEQGEDLILMDQHAASERVLYERLLAQGNLAAGLPAGRQALLTPLVWDVAPDQAETVRTFLPELAALGFILEEFGPHSFALKEWPVVLPETKEAKRFLDEVLEAFQDEKLAARTDVQHQIAARAACRAAVMAGDSLAPPEITQLLEDLSACQRPMTCPHGRPTHIRLTLTELHRRFGRL